MNGMHTHSERLSARSIRSTMNYLLWTLVWAGSYVLADKAALLGWYQGTTSAAIAVAVNLALGVVMVAAYMRHLRAMDELQRKIQMDALALSVGAGIVGGFAMMLMRSTGLSNGADIHTLILLIFATHIASTLFGCLRYR